MSIFLVDDKRFIRRVTKAFYFDIDHVANRDPMSFLAGPPDGYLRLPRSRWRTVPSATRATSYTLRVVFHHIISTILRKFHFRDSDISVL